MKEGYLGIDSGCKNWRGWGKKCHEEEWRVMRGILPMIFKKCKEMVSVELKLLLVVEMCLSKREA